MTDTAFFMQRQASIFSLSMSAPHIVSSFQAQFITKILTYSFWVTTHPRIKVKFLRSII